MSIANVELLDIICHPTPAIPVPHRLAILYCDDPQRVTVRTCVGEYTIEDAIIWRFTQGDARVMIAMADTDCPISAEIDILKGQTLEVPTGPIPVFDIFIMPSSHLCFGYFTGLPEHIYAGKVVAEAVDLIEENPNYHFSVEFMRGLANFVEKYPKKLASARRAFQEGRLGVSGIWSPSFFEIYDGEAQIRQLVESQWWLREHFGTTTSVAMGCDSPGFDPQQPQVFRQSGIDFFWRGRYTLWNKDFGSPFIEHVGVDGTRLSCLVPRPPVSSGYLSSPIDFFIAEGNDERFGEMVEKTATYLRQCKAICGVNFNVHCASGDQSRPDHTLADRLEAWNSIFRTPRLFFSSMVPMAEKLMATADFLLDTQEPEQPSWAPIEVAGYRLTHVFQEASYALATAEKAAAIDLVMNSTPYPAGELKAAWLNVIGEQHHEQLGYGAHDGVEHSRDLVRRATTLAQDITRCAVGRIASRIRFQESGKPVTVFNFINWKRRDIVELDHSENSLSVFDSHGNPVPHEVSHDGRLRFMAEAEALGYNTYYLASHESSPVPASDLQAGKNVIENAFYRLEINLQTGCIERLFDKELQIDILDTKGDRLPFELVLHEDNGKGYCTFWPTGKIWRSSSFANAAVSATVSPLSAKLIVDRGLLDVKGESCVGSAMRMEFELPTQTKRLDVRITLDWDSKEPCREMRLFLPLALEEPVISYDTLFATSDYDEDLPRRQHCYSRFHPWLPESEQSQSLFDWRHVTRFVSAFETQKDLSVTMTAPHGLLRVEGGGVSFTLIEDRTDSFGPMLPAMKGRHVFYTSLTSHRGNWKSAKAWAFGWEHRGHFNPMIAVLPEKLYPILDEQGTLVQVDGENLVLTALKKSNAAEDLIARVYDAAGEGDQLGIRLSALYLGHRPYEFGQVRHDVVSELSDRPLAPLGIISSYRTNLLEDTEEEIDLAELLAGRVHVPAHGIFTTRLVYEQPQLSWIPTFAIEEKFEATTDAETNK